MTESLQIDPPDEFNQQLVNQVHPPGWINPQPERRYNLVVIGAGTAGLVTAAGAAGLGAKVALIERHLMGGDCLNTGCVPSKAIIRSARAMHAVMQSNELGIQIATGSVAVNFPQVMERMRKLRADISTHDSAQRFKDLGVDVFIGDASFLNRSTIQVDQRQLEFKKAVIATGARAAVPEIEGLEETGFLTNETIFSLTQLPLRLAILGAGPIGCELAQAFARFGSEVTLIQSRTQILPREDRDAAQIIQRQLEQDGVKILLNAASTQIARTAAGKTIQIDLQGKQSEIIVDEILISTGRAPNVQGLNLEQAGVKYDEREGVFVNNYLQTTNSAIYAAGDICSRYQFTHTADFQARIVIGNALFKGRSKSSNLLIPWCTYTEPEIAHVGLYEHEAAAKNIRIQTFIQELKDVDRAILDAETNGFVKIHVKQGSDKILGATIVASHAGDLISEISVAMQSGMGLKKLASVIHPYPTQADAIRKIGDQYNRTRLSPLVKSIFNKWLTWSR
ncbi:mercuric reductase [Gimesia sp.]|uniref:mercuric reductase n=1 Tax=Gimesia sp. TaxID=2024833 RepID=UPI000C655802|nr:mercuric reductase [Gimesia sp.]MAX40426.1 mercuric reductase [Gimesia sp.]HBL43837.1 FAD-containing oxidoreductase [Planctomycetaceae bacterium]|tara:strand:- start:13957 stop:15480 length:1524 start_codon:yes stop_codon:yes gene_type:complete